MNEMDLRMACLQLAHTYAGGDPKMAVNIASHFYDFARGRVFVDTDASREIAVDAAE